MATLGKTASTPPPDLSKSFQRLAESAARLNDASDELSKAIAPIETVLKKLNLGISKWHTFAGGHPDQDGDVWSSEIGYAKVSGKWCVALAERSGNIQSPDYYDSSSEWAFNDAPRQLRIRAVKEIPKLLEALIEEADKVTSALETETTRAQELGETLTTLAAATRTRK
jgi:hypothetical protein